MAFALAIDKIENIKRIIFDSVLKELDMSIFEIVMLICFGVAWPISIVKSYKTKTAAGKSPVFLIVVLVGYISGMIHKWIFSRDFVMILYGLNFIMVSIDFTLWYRYTYKDQQKGYRFKLNKG